MKLHACIAHQLVKEQHQDIQPLVTSTEQLDCENELVNQLIERIDSVYGNRYNARQYGAFSTDADRGTFPDLFESYAAMIKEKPGITFSRELTPEELMTLDLEKLHQGLRINLNTYQDFLSNEVRLIHESSQSDSFSAA